MTATGVAAVRQASIARSFALLILFSASVAAVLLLRQNTFTHFSELGVRSITLNWGKGAPQWWSNIPVDVPARAKIPVVRNDASLFREDGYHDVSPAALQSAAVLVPSAAVLVPPSLPAVVVPTVAPATVSFPVPSVVPSVAVVKHVWGTKPHEDYIESTQAQYKPYVVVKHGWGTRPHNDYSESTQASFKPYPVVKHGWGTRRHDDYVESVQGPYRPWPRIDHHWGTRLHKDFADDVFGKTYHPDPRIDHHWGTRSHNDFADDVFGKSYHADPSWSSHWGTHQHKDYSEDVYGKAYHADPVVPYHWGTRQHSDYTEDVFSRPFVSWDMPYGVAAPRAGGFVQDISPSENKEEVMRAGAEDKSQDWYGYGKQGVTETGPGGTFKSWWPPGNRQQDVMGNGGNVVPTIRGDQGPNNYRIPFQVLSLLALLVQKYQY